LDYLRARILIDLQNGIAGLPLAPHFVSTVLENSNKVATALRIKGATIVYVRVAIAEILRLPVDAPIRDEQAPSPATRRLRVRRYA
jgi:nicotinamidase-related amidase